MTDDLALSRRSFLSAAAAAPSGCAPCGAAPRGARNRRRSESATAFSTWGLHDARPHAFAQGDLHAADGARLRRAGDRRPRDHQRESLLSHPGAERSRAVRGERGRAVRRPAQGAVSAFARDRATGALTLLVSVLGRGAPCYPRSPQRALPLRGNYPAAASPCSRSRRRQPRRGHLVVQHFGQGADPKRQASPHAHCIIPDPANRFVLVADLGLDRCSSTRSTAAPHPLARAGGAGVLAPGQDRATSCFIRGAGALRGERARLDDNGVPL